MKWSLKVQPAIKPNIEEKAAKGLKPLSYPATAQSAAPSVFSRFSASRWRVMDDQKFGHKLDFMSFNLTLEWSLLDFVWLGNRWEKVEGL